MFLLLEFLLGRLCFLDFRFVNILSKFVNFAHSFFSLRHLRLSETLYPLLVA